MRKAFSDTLKRVAEKNDRVIFLTGDLGFGVFDEFRAQFGPRYVNCGVAEAQLICASAGLALEGWRPIAYSIGSFATGRPFEQIRLDLCYHHLPVMLVGAGGGYTYSTAGVTHHSGEDLGLMSLLPGMTVVAPGSPEEISALMPPMLELGGPSYLRIGKFGEPDYRAEAPAVLGRARLLRKGEKAAILSTGTVASEVVAACDLLAGEGLRPAAYQFHTVKPLDTETLEKLAGEVEAMLVVEEHVLHGGLHAGVCAWRAGRTDGPRIFRRGVGDEFVLGSPNEGQLRARCGCDAAGIAEFCRGWWQERRGSRG